VPQAAVSRTPRGVALVMVVNAKSQVEQREVTADTAVGADWLVTGGLRPGERVIVEGLMKAKPGATVKAVSALARSGEK